MRLEGRPETVVTAPVTMSPAPVKMSDATVLRLVGALATVMAPELERRQWEERKQKQAEFDRLNEQYERRKKAEFSGGAPDDEQVAEGAEYDAYLAMTATGSRVLESRQAGTLDPDAVAKSTQAERDKGHESPFKGGL